jgi:hypothetical protein
MIHPRKLIWKAGSILSMLVFVVVLAAADDPSGDWLFAFQTPDGSREAPASLKVTGEQVTGKFVDADVKGTYKDGAIDCAFPFSSPEVGPGTMVIKGTMASGALSGTWEFAGYSGTFAARRLQ